MKTPAFGATPNSLPTVGGVAAAPTTPETGSKPAGADFLSLISQIYAGAAASQIPNQIPNGVKAVNGSVASGQEESDPSLANGLLPTMASLIAGAEAAEKSSSNENATGVKSKTQTSDAKSSNAVDETLASSVMAMLAQTVVLPKPEISVAPKAATTPSVVAGDQAPSAAPTIEMADSQTQAGNATTLPKQQTATVDSAKTATKTAVTDQSGNRSAKSSVEDKNVAAKPAQTVPAIAANTAIASDPANSSILTPVESKMVTEPMAEQSAILQSQASGVQTSGNGAPKAVGTISRDGTGVALNKERMNITTEKNEIAGRAVKKLPRDAQTRDFSTGSGTADLAKANSDAAATKKESVDLALVQETTNKATTTPLEQVLPTEKTVSTAAAQVEHVARLVSQEAMTVKQSGATSLAVSLKVDAHTQIFLQLSNTGGQMQASIRCEHGSLDNLGNHWNDLQASLARQNVQLLPLGGTNTNTGSSDSRTASNSNGGSSSDSNYQQSPGNFRRQGNETRDGSLVADADAAPKKKLKSGASAIKGWESWA